MIVSVPSLFLSICHVVLFMFGSPLLLQFFEKLMKSLPSCGLESSYAR